MPLLGSLGISEGRAWQQHDYENGGVPGKLISWLDNALTGNRDYQRTMNLNTINNAFNAMEAQKQRDYEERLSNSAYQRAAADAAAAGFNPGLIMSQGGASTPSGSAARSSGTTAFRSGDQFGSMLSGLFGLVGSLVATGMKTSAMEAAQDIRGQYTIDAAKLRGNSALVVAKTAADAKRDAADITASARRYAADRYTPEYDLRKFNATNALDEAQINHKIDLPIRAAKTHARMKRAKEIAARIYANEKK